MNNKVNIFDIYDSGADSGDRELITSKNLVKDLADMANNKQ